ncbi:MAG: hypothetical protein COW27_00490 [Nitrosopumilales archaeon CG15_BIG_FIL_POST_REV_8_21_14_020_37_12]|nr:MAG: hypothetical protein COW27_00490 [Nitrosopumilales archaeon CG15_BIG_FIL_POST_REV_8_21_14_020_37_12]
MRLVGKGILAGIIVSFLLTILGLIMNPICEANKNVSSQSWIDWSAWYCSLVTYLSDLITKSS